MKVITVGEDGLGAKNGSTIFLKAGLLTVLKMYLFLVVSDFSLSMQTNRKETQESTVTVR